MLSQAESDAALLAAKERLPLILVRCCDELVDSPNANQLGLLKIAAYYVELACRNAVPLGTGQNFAVSTKGMGVEIRPTTERQHKIDNLITRLQRELEPEIGIA
jgi:hypothetical protein